jgi:hypothetical protein
VSCRAASRQTGTKFKNCHLNKDIQAQDPAPNSAEANPFAFVDDVNAAKASTTFVKNHAGAIASFVGLHGPVHGL